MLENEMGMNADNLKSIVAQGNEMARAGHFDSAGILKAVNDFDRRLVLLGVSTFNFQNIFHQHQFVRLEIPC